MSSDLTKGFSARGQDLMPAPDTPPSIVDLIVHIPSIVDLIVHIIATCNGVY